MCLLQLTIPVHHVLFVDRQDGSAKGKTLPQGLEYVMDETTLWGVIDEPGSLIRNFADTQEGPARFNKPLALYDRSRNRSLPWLTVD